MKPLQALILTFLALTMLSCNKSDELATERYSGVWNYQTSQGCSQVMAVDPVSDNEVFITWQGCIIGQVKATINGNQINVANQYASGGSHQATGTITDNSMQFNSYRYGRGSQYWVMKVTATK